MKFDRFCKGTFSQRERINIASNGGEFVEDREKAYWNHEVSKILSVGESTLRKWCLSLEKNGYTFLRGKKDSRAFTQHDITALTYFKDLTKLEQLKMEEAAVLVVEKYGDRNPVVKEGERTTPVPEDLTSSIEEIKSDLKKLLGLYEEQVKFNEKLIEKLSEKDKQLELINMQLNKMNEEQAAAIEERTLLEMRSLEEKEEQEKTKKKTIVERLKSVFKS